jgi:hypothetical protein
MSGDQAAWRDLVARLELPQYVDPASAPWPERENVGSASAGEAGSGGAADHDRLQARSGQPEPAAGTNTESTGTQAGSRSGHGTGADRSRVIRPASFLPFGGEPTASVSPGPGSSTRGPAQHASADEPAEAEDRDFADYADHEADAESGADIDFLSYYDDLDDRYIPPPVPALPRLDPVARGAWTALFGGPAYLFVATMLNWQVPGWAALAGIIAFVAGFTVLVFRLGDGPSRRDGPDQGAVV